MNPQANPQSAARSPHRPVGASLSSVAAAWDNQGTENGPSCGAGTPARPSTTDPCERETAVPVSVPLSTDTRPAALVDGCPECVYNTEAPKSWIGDDQDVTCAYLCSDCGHAWLTNWMHREKDI